MMEGAFGGKPQHRGPSLILIVSFTVPGVKEPAVTDPRTQSKHGAACGTAGSA